VSGLTKVQSWLRREGEPLPKDDPYFATAPWRDAEIQPLPENWAGGIETGKLHPVQFDPATGRPREWPMRYTACRCRARFPSRAGTASRKSRAKCGREGTERGVDRPPSHADR